MQLYKMFDNILSDLLHVCVLLNCPKQDLKLI